MMAELRDEREVIAVAESVLDFTVVGYGVKGGSPGLPEVLVLVARGAWGDIEGTRAWGIGAPIDAEGSGYALLFRCGSLTIREWLARLIEARLDVGRLTEIDQRIWSLGTLGVPDMGDEAERVISEIMVGIANERRLELSENKGRLTNRERAKMKVWFQDQLRAGGAELLVGG